MSSVGWFCLEDREGREHLALAEDALRGGNSGVDADLDVVEARGLLPLVAWLATRDGRDAALPSPVRLRLQAALAGGRAGALRWEAAIEVVLEALASLHIRPVILKGADLAFHAYPEPGLRTMTDLDLLVPAERLADTRRALEGVGYRRIPTTFSDEWYAICRRQLPPLMLPAMGIHVDVHGSLMPPYSPYGLPEEAVAVRPSRWPAADRLRPELMLWHLATHSQIMHFGHVDHATRAVVDVLAMAASADEIEPRVVADLARQSRTAGALRRLLLLAGPPAAMQRHLHLVAAEEPGWHRRVGISAAHSFRSLIPWLGLGHGRPPDAWRQLAWRPARLVGALMGRRGGGHAPGAAGES